MFGLERMKAPVLTILFFLLLLSLGCNDSSSKNYSPPVQNLNLKPVNTEDDIKMLRTMVKEDPENLNAWIRLGNILMDSKRFTEAIEAYARALELDPRNVNVRVDMGTCYRNTGQPERAVEEYRKALTYNPKHLYAHKNLGVVLAYDLNRIKEAIPEFETYLKLSPTAPDAEQVKTALNELRQRI
jgi:tetratricopeptide (TPR) repeat protein